jgi:hypothetical protein
MTSMMTLCFAHRGTCKACELNCGPERWLDSCKGSSPGQCKACTVCARDEYEVSPCTETQNRVCASCASLPTCESGTYRQCGSGVNGTCEACSSCDVGHYRVGCGGLTPGRCVECAGCAPGKVSFHIRPEPVVQRHLLHQNVVVYPPCVYAFTRLRGGLIFLSYIIYI